MAKWRWIERKFNFGYPATKWPDLLERVRGTPARLEEIVRGLLLIEYTNQDDSTCFEIFRRINVLAAK